MLKTGMKLAAIAAFAGSFLITAAGASTASARDLGTATIKTPVRNETGFWSCWAARDFQGNGDSFTGGCWDAYMLTAMPASTEAKLRVIASDHARQSGATRDVGAKTAPKGQFEGDFHSVALPRK